MKNASPRTIRRSVEFENHLRAALSLTPSINGRERGWFPKLLLIVLKAYIENRGK